MALPRLLSREGTQFHVDLLMMVSAQAHQIVLIVRQLLHPEPTNTPFNGNHMVHHRGTDEPPFRQAPLTQSTSLIELRLTKQQPPLVIQQLRINPPLLRIPDKLLHFLPPFFFTTSGTSGASGTSGTSFSAKVFSGKARAFSMSRTEGKAASSDAFLLPYSRITCGPIGSAGRTTTSSDTSTASASMTRTARPLLSIGRVR